MTNAATTLSVDNFQLRINAQTLIDKLSFLIQPGEVVALMGPSGSGKSSLLNWLIGISDTAIETSGTAWLGDQRIDQQLPERRGLGLMFQDHGLFPHLSTEQNLLIGIPGKLPKSTRREMAAQALREAGLDGYGSRAVSSLSGGEQARVSLLRTLLSAPKALLLDEPFSALDDARRAQIRAFTFNQIATQQLPTLLVTHDKADIPDGTSQVINLQDYQPHFRSDEQ